jgi:hypothetical protein
MPEKPTTSRSVLTVRLDTPIGKFDARREFADHVAAAAAYEAISRILATPPPPK